jgi:tRNA(adenine34) deaminase
MQTIHEKYMRHCLQLATQALAKGNPPVGALLVQNEIIVGVGEEAGKSQEDITYHAEIEAVRMARKNLQKPDLSDCVLYTTHEPCWMCAYLIRHHQISKIVIGAKVDFIGGASSEFPILLTQNVPTWKNSPEIIWGVLIQECEALMMKYKSQHSNP